MRAANSGKPRPSLSPIPYTDGGKGRQTMRVLLAIAAIAMPMFTAHAQNAKIGVLAFQQNLDTFKDAFRAGLREHGFTEGKNIVVEWRGADGNVERTNQIAAEFVQAKVNVIVASLTPAVAAAQKAT